MFAREIPDKETQEIDLNLAQGDEVQILEFALHEVKKQAPQHYKESNFISLLPPPRIAYVVRRTASDHPARRALALPSSMCGT